MILTFLACQTIPWRLNLQKLKKKMIKILLLHSLLCEGLCRFPNSTCFFKLNTLFFWVWWFLKLVFYSECSFAFPISCLCVWFWWILPFNTQEFVEVSSFAVALFQLPWTRVEIHLLFLLAPKSTRNCLSNSHLLDVLQKLGDSVWKPIHEDGADN